MKGQRLFVRPIEPSDRDAIRSFLATEQLPSTIPTTGLIGKLVGDLVAVLAMEITADSLQIDDLVVARDLRRKRIGRVMLQELEQLATKMERRRLVVDGGCEAREFFRRVGFEREGERLVRRLR